jgi:hypothetical protein
MTALQATSGPALSVVMPSFNQAAFLGDAVRSVFRTQVDVELIVMDGGSTDGTQEILCTLAAEFGPRLRWSSGPDAGPAAAVNDAVALARAPLVGWLNSDDVYAPDAIDHAVGAFTDDPRLQMVYGQGQHIDERNAVLAAYPSQPPATPFERFADGCFICQPTAFFRKAAFVELGGLDTSFQAAFDFDFWLRLWTRYPGCVGFVDRVQASTRLHGATITARLRERVALEGLRIVRRHIGPPPIHWMMTHVEELAHGHPFLAERMALRERVQAVLELATPTLGNEGRGAVLQRLDGDARMRLGTESTAFDLYPDGWASSALRVRVRQGAQPVRTLRLLCRHQAPGLAVLRLDVHHPDGQVTKVVVDGQQSFSIDIVVADRRPGASLVYRIDAEGGFVPADSEPNSQDRRVLSYRVEGCKEFC